MKVILSHWLAESLATMINKYIIYPEKLYLVPEDLHEYSGPVKWIHDSCRLPIAEFSTSVEINEL